MYHFLLDMCFIPDHFGVFRLEIIAKCHSLNLFDLVFVPSPILIPKKLPQSYEI